MRPAALRWAAVTLMLCAGSAACHFPTAPEPLPFSTRPQIQRVDLAASVPAAQPVPATVHGVNFLSGLTVVWTNPRLEITTIQGLEIDELTGSSFSVRLPIREAGRYFLFVQTEAGLASPSFELQVAPPTAP